MNFRHLTLADSALMLTWCNDPAALAASRTTEPATYEGHMVWMRRMLGDFPCRQVVICEIDAVPVGFVRFDGNELSWYVAAAHRRAGIGTRMLREALARYADDHACAWIKPDNVASLRLVQRCGFEARESATELAFFVWTRGLSH